MKASLSKRKHRIVEDITSFLTKKRRDKYRNCFIRLLCNGLPTLLSKIERSVYNKRKLFTYIEQIRNKLSDRFNEFEEYFIGDSMPL